MTPPTRTPNKSPGPGEAVASGPAAAVSAMAEAELRKRVVKACDRCRLKKIKCDGQLPCSRCQSDNSVCRYVERKRSTDRRIPPGYVEYLEDQQGLLVSALKKSWAQSRASSSAPSTPGSNDPPVHKILEELGVLSEIPNPRSGEAGFEFEEDVEVLRRKMEEEASEDTSPEKSQQQLPSTRGSTPASVRSVPSDMFHEGIFTQEPQSESSGQAQVRLGAGQPHSYDPLQAQYLQHSQIQLPTQQQSYSPFGWQASHPYSQTAAQLQQRSLAPDYFGIYASTAAQQQQQTQQQPHSMEWRPEAQYGAPPNPPFRTEDSTISPQDLTLPAAGAYTSYTEEEQAWNQWLSEHPGEHSRAPRPQ